MTFRQRFRDVVAPIIRDGTGDPAVFTPAGGGAGVPVTLRFDEGGFQQFDIESAQPGAEVLTSDLPPGDPTGGTLVVDGRNFKVVGVDPDNIYTRLTLEDQDG